MLTEYVYICLLTHVQRKEYVKYAKVFPLTAIMEIKIPSKWYRRVVGILEVVCGLAMAAIPSRKSTGAALVRLSLSLSGLDH